MTAGSVAGGRHDDRSNRSQRPLVSVVVIFCNEIDFLAEAVESVYHQTVNDWELVLVDDGSVDGSTDVARGFAADRPRQVRFVDHAEHRTLGMSASRNAGVEAADGRYIAYLDADDRWLPEKLERQLAAFAEHPEVGIVYGPLTRWYSWTGRPEDQGRDDLYGIHGDGYTLPTPRLFQPPELVALFIRHKDLVPSGAMFERALFLSAGGAEAAFTDNYEDAVAFVKMGLQAAVYCDHRAWYLYRQYPSPEDRRRRAVNRPDAARVRGDAARLRFLQWVEQYLATNRIEDPSLARSLRAARRQVLHPRRHRLLRTLSRVSAAVAGLSSGAVHATRRAVATPKPTTTFASAVAPRPGIGSPADGDAR